MISSDTRGDRGVGARRAVPLPSSSVRPTTLVWLSCTLALLGVFLFEGRANAESIRLAWYSDQAGGIGYNVYRSLTAGGPYTLLTAQPIQTLFYVDDSAAAGQTHYYTVTAVNGLGSESGFAGEVPITLGRFDLVPRGTSVVVRSLPDISAVAGQMVILSGSAHNPENKGLSYLWTQFPSAAVPITGRTNPEASFMAPRVSQDTLLTFVLVVTDSDGYTVADTIRVTVHPK